MLNVVVQSNTCLEHYGTRANCLYYTTRCNIHQKCTA